MAVTTLKAIIDRFQTILEGSNVNLKPTREPFTHDRQPNTLLTDSYRVADAGLQNTRSITNEKEARIDRIQVFVARKLAFDGQTAAETMHTTLNTIERYIVADGPANSYHASLSGRQVTPSASKDFLIGSVIISVDYDYNVATS